MKYRLKVPAEQFNIKLLYCVKEITSNNEYCELYYSYYSFYVELTRRCSECLRCKKGSHSHTSFFNIYNFFRFNSLIVVSDT